MPLEQLDSEYRWYRHIKYQIKVYYEHETVYTNDDHRLVIVEPFGYQPSIETVRLSYPLNPTSMWPWKDPDPVPKDEHVERAVNRFEARVDDSLTAKEKARK